MTAKEFKTLKVGDEVMIKRRYGKIVKLNYDFGLADIVYLDTQRKVSKTSRQLHKIEQYKKEPSTMIEYHEDEY